MQIKPDIEAVFEFTKLRKVYEGYRPAHLVREDYLTTGVHNYYDTGKEANDKLMGTITFISPEKYPGCMWIGKKIKMYEGRNLVGYATVTKVFNPLLIASENM